MNFVANNANVNTNAATSTRNSGAFVTPSTFVGARIAGQPTYTPAHQKQGAQKPTSAKCELNVILNVWGQKQVYRFTAWNKMADVIARGAATGKEITLVGTPKPYQSRVWVETAPGSGQRTFLTDATGQPIMVSKIGYTIESMHWGVDSAKTVQEEIAAGVRPADWNNPAGPGHATWLQICAGKNNEQYQAGSPTFGYARVQEIPQGAVLVNNQANTYANQPVAGQPVAGQAQGTVQPQYQANPQAVNQAMPAQGGQPVMVQGQNMGYAPNAQAGAPAGQVVV